MNLTEKARSESDMIAEFVERVKDWARFKIIDTERPGTQLMGEAMDAVVREMSQNADTVIDDDACECGHPKRDHSGNGDGDRTGCYREHPTDSSKPVCGCTGYKRNGVSTDGEK